MMEYMEIPYGKGMVDKVNVAAKDGWRLITMFHPMAQTYPGVVHAIMERTVPKKPGRKPKG